ncbi:MAG: hypothetical protein ABI396_14255 [Ktedonobacteraceae bacterium]
MAGPWDSIMKRMIGANPEHFVNWLSSDATFISAENVELKNQHRYADALLTVAKGTKRGLRHIEFQTYHDPEMAERLLVYNVMAFSQYQLPVASTVIYLINTGAIPTSPYTRRFLDDEEVHHFFYKIVKVWEEEAETILQMGRGIWPLVPLTKDGKRPEVITGMIERLAEAKAYDLLAMVRVVGGLVFQTESEREGFQRRFRMYQDVLRESWVYQEIGQEYLEKGLEQGLEQGRKQGIEQALHQTLLIYVETRFPQLVVLAQQQIGFITDVALLNQIMSTLFTLQTTEEVERYLRKLGNDATKS